MNLCSDSSDEGNTFSVNGVEYAFNVVHGAEVCPASWNEAMRSALKQR